MGVKVKKRDGKVESFDYEKITNAVRKAYADVGVDAIPKKIEALLKKTFTSYVEANNDCEPQSIEAIQDIVERTLMNDKTCDVAKHYILYRNERSKIRERKSKLIRDIASKLCATNIENQNANVDELSFGGRRGEAERIVSKQYALDNCMSSMARENHLANEIYIHDLDSYAVGMHNCLSIPFDDLLAHGFTTRQCDVRPANSANTAFQLVAVIFQLQSLQQFGGVSATHLDHTMVPYVRRSFMRHFVDGMHFIAHCDNFTRESLYECDIDETTSIDDAKYASISNDVVRYARTMTEREVYQGVEGLYHNLNTLQSRSGNQLPFTSINYGTCTSTEGRLVTRALLDVSIAGLGAHGATSIFPCGIFQYMRGVNDVPGTPNYDLKQLALRSTSRRLYPNYANVDWSGNAGYDINDPRTYFSTMGCRTANGFDVNGFGQMKDGRGNIAPVTLILPTLAMRANRDVETFMALLDKKIDEARDMLIERFNWIASQSSKSARFMYDNNTMYGYDEKEGIVSALRHGTLAIGQLGLAETLQLLVACDHTSERGMELAHRIESLFRTKCDAFKKAYKLNFGVYYTPAENLCHTALRRFVDEFGVIENVSDKQFFTNSMHVPVWVDVDPFTKIDIESQLTSYSNAGCITYVELPSTVTHNIEALERIVDYAMEHDVPYFAVNVPVTSCNACGTTGDFDDVCPTCGSDDLLILKRVTGYLSSDYRSFNAGKVDEANRRVRHTKN